MTYVLRTNHLTKRYGIKAVVDNLNMNIRYGDIYGFLGQNGAEKTTTLRMIMGLIQHSAGEIELFGTGLNGSRSKYLERIVAIIEYPGFYLNLSGAENLEIHCRLMGMCNQECLDEVLDLMITDYTVVEHGILRLYERLDKSAEVNSVLNSHDNGVSELTLSRDSLEGYFIKLTGGDKFV